MLLKLPATPQRRSKIEKTSLLRCSSAPLRLGVEGFTSITNPIAIRHNLKTVHFAHDCYLQSLRAYQQR